MTTPLYRPGPCGSRTALNITAGTQVKSGQGLAFLLLVNTAPSADGGVYDAADASGATADNLIVAIPTSVSIPNLDLRGINFFNGLYIDPGTSGVVSIAYE